MLKNVTSMIVCVVLLFGGLNACISLLPTFSTAEFVSASNAELIRGGAIGCVASGTDVCPGPNTNACGNCDPVNFGFGEIRWQCNAGFEIIDSGASYPEAQSSNAGSFGSMNGTVVHCQTKAQCQGCWPVLPPPGQPAGPQKCGKGASSNADPVTPTFPDGTNCPFGGPIVKSFEVRELLLASNSLNL